MAEEKKLSGPDFAQGVSLTEFTDGGMLQGHAKGESILVARRGEACFAIGATSKTPAASVSPMVRTCPRRSPFSDSFWVSATKSNSFMSESPQNSQPEDASFSL